MVNFEVTDTREEVFAMGWTIGLTAGRFSVTIDGIEMHTRAQIAASGIDADIAGQIGDVDPAEQIPPYLFPYELRDMRAKPRPGDVDVATAEEASARFGRAFGVRVAGIVAGITAPPSPATT